MNTVMISRRDRRYERRIKLNKKIDGLILATKIVMLSSHPFQSCVTQNHAESNPAILFGRFYSAHDPFSMMTIIPAGVLVLSTYSATAKAKIREAIRRDSRSAHWRY
jgi:hypothetical protein